MTRSHRERQWRACRGRASRPSPRHPAHQATSRSGCTSITSKYALVLVWAAMALVYYILMPRSFGSMGAVRAIFGGQPVLVFLAMSALVTLLVAEFDLSVASIMGLAADDRAGARGAARGQHVGGVPRSPSLACMSSWARSTRTSWSILDVSAFVVDARYRHAADRAVPMALPSSNVVSVQDPTSFGNLALHPVLGMPVSFWYGVALAVCSSPYLHRLHPPRAVTSSSSGPPARSPGSRACGSTASGTGALHRGPACSWRVWQGSSSSPRAGWVRLPRSGQFLLRPALAAVFLGTTVVQPGQFNLIGTLIAI